MAKIIGSPDDLGYDPAKPILQISVYKSRLSGRADGFTFEIDSQLNPAGELLPHILRSLVGMNILGFELLPEHSIREVSDDDSTDK